MFRFKCRAWPVLLALSFLVFCISPIPLPAFQGNALAEVGPDLAVQSVTWSPTAPVINDTVYFTVTVKNYGDSPSGSFYVMSFIDDIQIGNNYVNPIFSGSVMSYIFTWKARAGDHVVRVVCDSEDDVIESNEENNDKTYAFSVLAPDLVISAIDCTPESPSIDEETTLSVTIKNQGNKMSTACSIVLSLDNSPMGYRPIDSLEPGANATVTYNTIATSGRHELNAIADVLEQIKESNESNNSKTRVYYAATPDLTISSITWSPVNRSENENVTFSITVKNSGSGKADFSTLGFYIDDICQTAIMVDELKVNASSVKTVSFPLDSHEHTIKAIADISNVLGESDETNNILTANVSSLSPDLIIQSITWSPATPLIAQKMSFTVTVKNQGKIPCGPFELSFYVQFYNKSVSRCVSLDPDTVTAFTFPWTTEEKTMSVEAIVDEPNVITESNENNNVARANIGFSPSSPNVDLQIESLACTPVDPLIGEAVNITLKVKNAGTGEARPSHVAYYIDDTLLDSVYVKEIPANRSLIIDNTVWYAESGIHKLKAVIDCNNSVPETNENNNEKIVTLTTYAPDLVIENVTWWPLHPVVGENVNFTLTVKNQGDRKAGSSYLTYYVDGSYRGNHYVEDIEAGATVNKAFDWTMQQESQVFRVVIDEANNVLENQDYNNEKKVFLPSADLVVSNIICTPENPSENTTITFIVNITNQGEGPSPESRVVYYFDGNIFSSRDIDEIKPGVTVSENFSWKAKAGMHELRAIADGTNLFVEPNETNNALGLLVFIPQTASIEIPVMIPVTENIAAPTTKPTPKPTVETKKPVIVTTTGTVQPTPKPSSTVIKEILPDIAKKVSETPAPEKTPVWKKILLNRLLIITVAVVGIALISVLLVFRKRSGKTETGEKPPKQKAPKQKPSKEKPPKQASAPPKQATNPPKQAGNPPNQAVNPPKPAANPPAQAVNPPKQTVNPPAQTGNPPAQNK